MSIFKGEIGAHKTTRSDDMRQCTLCQQYGDSAPQVCERENVKNVFVQKKLSLNSLFFPILKEAGRLLYLGQNEWAHINCCLWSAEVYEDNSALLQVHSAVSRGRHLVRDAILRSTEVT